MFVIEEKVHVFVYSWFLDFMLELNWIKMISKTWQAKRGENGRGDLFTPL